MQHERFTRLSEPAGLAEVDGDRPRDALGAGALAAIEKVITIYDPPFTMLFNGYIALVSMFGNSGFARVGALCLLAGCSAARSPSAKVYPCEVVNTFPHDTNAFTQGLAYGNGELYEGTGLNGRSSIRCVELVTGTVLRRHDLPWKYFGEGITLWEDKLIQLTWTSRTAFVYDRRSFRLLSSFSYPTEGWGLTHDGTRLIMSDGSATLYFRDPDTFAETGRIRVTDGGVPVSHLNELEFIRGEIWANVWRQYRIACISPVSGEVLAWIDISGLMSPLDRLLAGSPNGIAYDAKTDRIFVTGKRWPKVFEIQVNGDACDLRPTLFRLARFHYNPTVVDGQDYPARSGRSTMDQDERRRTGRQNL